MILLKLNKYELVTLSTFSKIDMQRPSPILAHGAVESIEFNQEGFKKAYDGFKSNGFLVEAQSKDTLATELESAFLLLHQPEVVVSIKNHREVNVLETNYSFRSGFAMEMTSDAYGDHYMLTYPHVLPSVGACIREAVFNDEIFSGTPFERKDMELSIEELLVLTIYMSFIQMRVDNKGDALLEDETYIAKDAIRYFDKIEEISPLIVQLAGSEEIVDYIRQAKEINFAIIALIARGILIERDDEIAISELGKCILNPTNLKGSYLIGEHLPLASNLTTLNVMDSGYILIRTVNNSSVPVVQVSFCPPATDALDVMKIACPVAFMNGFGDEVGYQKKLNESIRDKNKSSDKEIEVSVQESEVVEASNKFCVQCGNPLPLEAMFCSNCGAKQP